MQMMTVLVVGNWAFVIFYLTGRLLGAERVSIPHNLSLWISTHGSLATLSLIFVSVVLLARLTERGSSDTFAIRRYINRNHRCLATIAAVLWLFSNAAGIFNAFLLSYGK